jgi:hypothetical protein
MKHYKEFKDKYLEDKPISNAIKWHGDSLRISKEGIPKRGSEHESKTPKRETNIKMGTRQKRCHTEGRKKRQRWRGLIARRHYVSIYLQTYLSINSLSSYYALLSFRIT